MTFMKYVGDVAQLVEHRTENPCVGGSNPLITTLNAITKLVQINQVLIG